ncbi:hypothetical protein MTR67_043724, partial [Solanum verrucosum]
SNRDTQFTSQYLKCFQKGLGTRVKVSTTFHHHTNGYHSRISMAPFEALYGRRYGSTIGWFEVCEVGLIGRKMVHEAMEKV